MKFLLVTICIFYVLIFLLNNVSSEISSFGCHNYTNYYCTIVKAQDSEDDCKVLACFIALGGCYSARTKEMLLSFDKVLWNFEHLVDSEGDATIVAGKLNDDFVIIALHEQKNA